jgi:hypothetical protein
MAKFEASEQECLTFNLTFQTYATRCIPPLTAP